MDCWSFLGVGYDLDDLAVVCAEVARVVSPVFAVGGCVRDALLGKPIEDFDFTTPLLPDAIEASVRAAGRRAYTIGKRFGTIGFRLGGRFIEVTTFRAEQYARHNRKPEVIFLAELDGDLSRRDFTINAIAFDGQRLLDPFGGRSDLEQGVVRAVGLPDERLRDDPLRILRAARFAAVLGFSVDPELLAAMGAHWPLLAAVSRERWAIELEKLLAGDYLLRGLRLLRESGALQLVLPELAWLDDPQWAQVELTLAGQDGLHLALGDSFIGQDTSPVAAAGDSVAYRRMLENRRLCLLLVAAAEARGLTSKQARLVALEQAPRIAGGLRFSRAQTAGLLDNLTA
jgi:tRNA nucleotidyltransferase/poly(A) polymerase